MFSDKQKEAYSAVKSPEELRERILASAEKSEKDNNTVLFKTQFSRIVAAAACIVLVAVAAFYAFNGNRIEVSVNGVDVAENETVALTNGSSPLARNAAQAEINLKLELDSDALITVDSGSFDVVGKEENNLTEYSAEESIEIVWRSDGMQKSEMTVDYGRKTCVLVLEYNGEWIVTRK